MAEWSKALHSSEISCPVQLDVLQSRKRRGFESHSCHIFLLLFLHPHVPRIERVQGKITSPRAIANLTIAPGKTSGSCRSFEQTETDHGIVNADYGRGCTMPRRSRGKAKFGVGEPTQPSLSSKLSRSRRSAPLARRSWMGWAAGSTKSLG